MIEREKWDSGVASLIREYEGFSPGQKSLVEDLAAAIKSCKGRLHLIVEGVGAGEICARCSGECCKGGKNHVRGVDLIVYMNDGRDLFSPRFELEICPYMGDSGCLMGPEYRPYNCISFICEKVEELLSPMEKERYYALEAELRSLYCAMEQLLDNSFRFSLMSVFERRQREKPINGKEIF